MNRPTRIALGALGVLQLIAVVGCALLAIWGTDDRWAQTGFLLLVTGFITIAVATFPGLS